MIKIEIKAVIIKILKLHIKAGLATKDDVVTCSWKELFPAVLCAIDLIDKCTQKDENLKNTNDLNTFKIYWQTFKKLPAFYCVENAYLADLFECFLSDALDYVLWSGAFKGNELEKYQWD